MGPKSVACLIWWEWDDRGTYTKSFHLIEQMFPGPR